MLRISILEPHDPRWTAVMARLGMDLHALPGLARLEARDGRTVMVSVDGPAWSAAEVFLLLPAVEGRSVARTTSYGGPWLLGHDGEWLDTAMVLRSTLDGILGELGVVSEVSVLSPWVPAFDAVVAAWKSQPTRQVVLADLVDMESRWAGLSSDRRSEVRRVRREASTSWLPFGPAEALEFAGPYAEAMSAQAAALRWRHDGAHFQQLAASLAGKVYLSSVRAPAGGASAMFLVDGTRASYLYAVRWGTATGSATGALWAGQERLAAMGVRHLLLGGGVSDADDDPLLRFKRGLGNRVASLHVSGRIFDRQAAERAVTAGLLRPAPAWAVDVSV